MAHASIEEHIADLLACQKQVVGRLSWERERDKSAVFVLKAMVQPEIETECRLMLVMSAETQSSYQRGSIILTCDQLPIERMEHRNRRPHTNRIDKLIPAELRGIEIAADIPRYYSWENNRRYNWPKAGRDNLPICCTIDKPLEYFRDSVSYFLERTNILAEIPPLDFDARFEL